MLRLALYELEYEGLAVHALDEHVELARGVAGPNSFAPAFVNWVLREAGRRAEAKTLPRPEVGSHTHHHMFCPINASK